MSSSGKKNISTLNQQEFTAQKVNELKARYPTKKEAQIKKMVKGLLDEQKKRLLETCNPSTSQKKNTISNEDDPNSEQKTQPIRLFASNQKPIAIPVSLQNIDEELMNGDQSILSEVSITETPDKKKAKKIKKAKKSLEQRQQGVSNEYHQFFKYYKQKLSSQHPKWSFHQVRTIIHLLWRRKRISMKLIVHPKLIQNRTRRNPITGRRYFGILKRKENMNNDMIQSSWYHLTRENRKYTANIGANRGIKGFVSIFEKMPKTMKFGLSTFRVIERTQPKTLSFMNSF